ncbi:arp2/3 complex 16 kda subunit [Dacryopinax primogenitus]|uniref:Actin-related protein 2/3 complex subunit 5 n=1 Tax=Dacryopinax primogenitus (strain DJM 731) TaxID=1858805 RepID=M5FPN8_DACPD|nr:arp2/3 complex 16 kda subunit [Dacryopinax primogenitus]EJT97198.1 arp2/3 complex 16 kda subunit [Dacryopinax primogenitus]
MDTHFRRINIDQYDEDVLLPSELYDPDPRSPAQVQADAQQRSSSVQGSLSRGDVAGALVTVLDRPAYGEGVDEAKAQTLSTLLLILNSTKTSDIPTLVRALSEEQQDTLMKYLYKGMASLGEEVNGSVLLGWHERLTEVAGVGCIVRVMTDRRTV